MDVMLISLLKPLTGRTDRVGSGIGTGEKRQGIDPKGLEDHASTEKLIVYTAVFCARRATTHGTSKDEML